MLSFLGMVTILCSSLLRGILSTPFCSTFIIFFIAVPRVARVLICPLQHCPACHSKATWNQGSPLLGVHRFWLLTLHHRCACSPSVRQCTL
jgi:hypothetical protein